MTETKLTVSHSELESFLKCERQHFFAYGLRLRSLKKSDPLARGTFGHAVVEQAFNYRLDNPGCSADDAFQAAYRWAGDQVLEDLTEGTGDLNQYWSEIRGSIKEFQAAGGLLDHEILAVEYRRESPVAADAMMSGVIDLIVRDDDGLVGVIDHKFVSRDYLPYQFELMPQLVRYIAALRSQGLPVDWVAYSVFNWKKKTWTFKKLDPSETRIQTVTNEFVLAHRRVMRRRQQTLAEWSDDALRVFDKETCNFCDFKVLCIGEQNGEDTQFILDQNFRVRESETPNEQVE